MNGSWKTLIQFLYHDTSTSEYISPFWTEILKLSELGSKCVQYTPGHNSSVRFWEDIWLGHCSLSSQYPQLYANCRNPHVLFQEVINTQGEAVLFADILTGVCLAEWNTILNILSHFSFTHHFDKLAWRWTDSGHFSVHSLYLILNYRGVMTEQPLLWWLLPIPPKIKIFMWLTFRNKILTRSNLHKKGWDGPTHCVFCTQPETVNHLFVQCPLIQQIWHWLGHTQEYYQNWHSLKIVYHFAVSLPTHEKHAFLIVFSGTCWTVWKHRNEICFQNVSQKTVRSLIYLILSLVSYWIGSSRIKQKVKEATYQWLPETMDAVPLCIIRPGEKESESFHLLADSSIESVEYNTSV